MNNPLLPAGDYHVLIHRLVTQGKVLKLHCSVIESGQRLSLLLFNWQVPKIISATMRQNMGDGFEGGQLVLTLAVDPELDVNKVKQISKVARLIDVQSDVIVTPPSREYCEFGAL